MPLNLDPSITLSDDPFELLQTAFVLSLKCRRRARAGDDLIDPTVTHGWWGDTYPDVEGDEWGSRLWTLIGRGMDVGMREAPGMIREALQWAIDDKVVTAIEVEVEPVGPNILGALVSGVLPSGEIIKILTPWYVVT